MDAVLFVNQLLNGVQLGLILFLLAAGLSLVFGIMDFINLAHGVFYMVGAYICATVAVALDSFLLGFLVALPVTLVMGLAPNGCSCATSTSATISTTCSSPSAWSCAPTRR